MDETKKIKGFLGRDHHQARLTDIGEIMLSYLILLKCPDQDSSIMEKIIFSPADLFLSNFTHQKLEELLINNTVISSHRMNEIVADFFSALTGRDIVAKTEELNAVDFYNGHFDTRFIYIKRGDSTGIDGCIEDYVILKEGRLHSYVVSIIPSKLKKLVAKNVIKTIYSRDELYDMMAGKVKTDIRIHVNKQVEFLKEYLDKRQALTSETKLSFTLRDVNYRHLIQTADLPAATISFLAPLTTDMHERLLLPIFLELSGIIDIESIKLTNSPVDIDRIEILYSISKPAIKNRFVSKAFNLTPENRNRMSETEIALYESIYRNLSQNYIFAGRTELENDFSNLCFWTLKKVSYCLEEPTFLKNASMEWQTCHQDDDYQQMEDDFFLPFIFEKLKYDFGTKIIKKPEKFGGEIDILFGHIPIELKVRKKSKEPLLDSIVDDKYRPAFQAATYASISRVGFIFVLDIPESQNEVTNINNCIKIIERQFDPDNPFKTMIVVCVFYANQPKPSDAK